MFGKRSTSEDQEEGSDADIGEETDSGPENQGEEPKFWSKVCQLN